MLHLCLTLSTNCTARRLRSALPHYGSPRVCYDALHLVTLLLHHDISGTYSSICCRGFGTVPCGDITFDTTFVPHNCFSTREAMANAFYSLDLVQPVVHPYELWGPLRDCPWYSFYAVFPSRQWSEFQDYIKIYAVSGDPYDPYDTDKRLPKEHRRFTVCAECGRQAQDCWAMGSMVNFNSPFDQPSYVACVYCSTYRALAFMEFSQS